MRRLSPRAVEGLWTLVRISSPIFATGCSGRDMIVVAFCLRNEKKSGLLSCISTINFLILSEYLVSKSGTIYHTVIKGNINISSSS